MRYQINAPVLDLDNAEVKFEEKLLTFGDLIFRTLVTIIDPKEDGIKKFESYKLAIRIKSAINGDGFVQLSNKEAEKIRVAASQIWSVIPYGRLVDLLESETT